MGVKSLGIGLSGLRANLAAIDTVGHNIANANTEGYSRQRVEFTPREPDVSGSFSTGRGVKVSTVTRISDQFLEGRVRKENSLLSNLEQTSKTLKEVEFVINELSDQDLSSNLNEFYSALQDFSNQVDDTSTRVALLEQAQSLANEFNRIDRNLKEIQDSIDGNMKVEVESLNQRIDEIASINAEIIAIETGGLSTAVANDLRDKRDVALRKLSAIVQIDVKEESNGAVLVLTGGQRLVSQGESFHLEAKSIENSGTTASVVQYKDGTSFQVSGGKLGALAEGRDIKVAGLREKLDDMAGRFIFEFNKIHATGRGTEGLTKVQAERYVFDQDMALDVAKMNIQSNDEIFKVQNGSFDIVVENSTDGTTKAFNIKIDLNGIGNETSLNDVMEQLNVVPNIKAEINAQKKLEIKSTNSNVKFHFANDTSNFLATFGIHSFFKGSGSASMVVNEGLRSTPSIISGGLGASQGDNQNALRMIDMRAKAVFNDNQLAIDELYQTIVGNIAVESNRFKDLVKTHELIATNLQNLRDEISDVSMDEEAADLLKYQRSYQASARFVAVVSEILETLIFRLGS